jgi:hypothetical protein
LSQQNKYMWQLRSFLKDQRAWYGPQRHILHSGETGYPGRSHHADYS